MILKWMDTSCGRHRAGLWTSTSVVGIPHLRNRTEVVVKTVLKCGHCGSNSTGTIGYVAYRIALFVCFDKSWRLGNAFHITVPLWGESTGDRWISSQSASDAEIWWLLCIQIAINNGSCPSDAYFDSTYIFLWIVVSFSLDTYLFLWNGPS